MTIANVVGTTGVNGTFVIASVPSPTTFTISLATVPGAYGYGGAVTPPYNRASPYVLKTPAVPTSVTSASWAAGVATLTAPNGFSAGQTVVVAGMTPSGFNGVATIISANSRSWPPRAGRQSWRTQRAFGTVTAVRPR